MGLKYFLVVCYQVCLNIRLGIQNVPVLRGGGGGAGFEAYKQIKIYSKTSFSEPLASNA